MGQIDANPRNSSQHARGRLAAFSLRSLFLAVTLVAAWLGWNLHAIRARQMLRAELEQRGAQFVIGDELHHSFLGPYSVAPHLPPTVTGISRSRQLLGDEPVSLIVLPPIAERIEQDRIRRVFPEAYLNVWVGQAY